MPRIATALALAFFPALASAEACPWLSAEVAAKVILATPSDSKVERSPVFGNTRRMEASTTCRFKAADELTGGLSVIVMEFVSYEAATSAYQGELKAQGSRARPSKIGDNPAFFTQDPGLSAASYAVKGRRLVHVNHAFGKRVNEAVRENPDGAVLSTHEVARQVLERL